MRRLRSYPRPGDRVRLALPPRQGDGAPLLRYGTVLERSSGRSNALRVRWDDTGGRASAAADGSTVGWLADASWYWDRSQLQVVDRHEAAIAAPAAAGPSSAEPDPWLAAAARPMPVGAGAGGLDAAAEWEAALDAELASVTRGSWDGAFAAGLPEPVAARPVAAPAAVPAPAAPPERPAAPPAPARPQAAPAPVAAPAPAWTGGDILPRKTAKRGRR